MRVARWWSIAAIWLMVTSSAFADRLTVERIYSDPELNGPSPHALKLAPDGRSAAFLRGRDSDQNQLDLWLFDVASGQSRRLVDSAALGTAEEPTEAERMRRERARLASLKGIVGYRWAPDSRRLLFGLGERLWLFDFDAKAGHELKAITPAGLDVLDAKFSPRGRYVSFVSKQNLYTIDLSTALAHKLTRDGAGTIHNGEAEFVAQEEMERGTGYWWAPDDSYIAYERYDAEAVHEIKRVEVYADRTEIVPQRYPAAGTPNVHVQLGLVKPQGGSSRFIDLGREPDIYLARIDWLPNGRELTYQRESRDQRKLDLVLVSLRDGAERTLLTETRDTWVRLHDDLRFIGSGNQFVWASDRDGYKHLYLYGIDGKPVRQLTSGDWDVDKVLALDESASTIYVEGNVGDALTSQVYAVSLDGRDVKSPRRVSVGDGWHEVAFADNAKSYIDTYSDSATPPQVALRSADGSLQAWIEENKLAPGHPYWPYRDALVQPTFGTLAAADVQTLHYRVYKPLGFDPARRYPVFMRFYGGPGRQVVNRAWGEHFDQVMAQRGYVVFTLDNRGTPRRGRAFANALAGRLGEAEVADQLVGIDWLQKQPWVDRARIGVFGWSYGGFMTMMMLSKASDRIAAGAAVAPVSDWSLYDTHYTERYLGAPQKNPQNYELSNVLHWLDGLTSPLLLVHGMADDNVLFAHSTKIMAALQQRGTPFELMTYPGGKHGLSTPAMRKHVYTLIADFFDRKVKNREIPAQPLHKAP